MFSIFILTHRYKPLIIGPCPNFLKLFPVFLTFLDVFRFPETSNHFSNLYYNSFVTAL